MQIYERLYWENYDNDENQRLKAIQMQQGEAAKRRAQAVLQSRPGDPVLAEAEIDRDSSNYIKVIGKDCMYISQGRQKQLC